MKFQLFNKDLKEKFFWPLLIGVITFSITTAYSVFSEKKNKQLQLREKKLTLIADLAESYETYHYYSGFRGMMDLEQMEYVKYFAEIKGDHIQQVELSIKQRILLADTLRKMYSLPYEKMMEGDVKSSVLFKNIHLSQLLFTDSVKVGLNNLLSYVPIDNKINEYVANRMQSDSTKLSEKEKNKILQDIQSETSTIFSKVLNDMVAEIK
ncbi:hypothetical protein [Aurantibacillus circumpalustris]|uniref:hypothetical protein n=1 Tax=Aurantibacillus circumpalustris TaxID=3036359 RepID=UPI00295BB8E8|nr:hypothetical protein [Aurantibacillus circumpalustris]